MQICLKDTLGPRWASLMSIASGVDSFRLVDHLTVLSTVSGDEFASMYDGMRPGFAFDAACTRDWQQANVSVRCVGIPFFLLRLLTKSFLMYCLGSRAHFISMFNYISGLKCLRASQQHEM